MCTQRGIVGGCGHFRLSVQALFRPGVVSAFARSETQPQSRLRSMLLRCCAFDGARMPCVRAWVLGVYLAHYNTVFVHSARSAKKSCSVWMGHLFIVACLLLPRVPSFRGVSWHAPNEPAVRFQWACCFPDALRCVPLCDLLTKFSWCQLACFKWTRGSFPIGMLLA